MIATSDVYGVLDDIRTRPRYWDNLTSLSDVKLLLDGYHLALRNHDADEALDFPFGKPGPFSVWVALRHPTTYERMGRTYREAITFEDWPTSLERVAAEQGVPAFELFFELVDEFRDQRAAYRFGRAAERVPDEPTAVDVPFTAIAGRPVMPWFQQGDAEHRSAYPLVAVIQAQPQWHRQWTLENAGQENVVPVPEVDFTTSTVVVVEIGARGSGGHSVEIERIVEADGVLYVCAVETQPGRQAVVTAAVTFPTASATIARFDGPARVVLRTRGDDG